FAQGFATQSAAGRILCGQVVSVHGGMHRNVTTQRAGEPTVTAPLPFPCNALPPPLRGGQPTPTHCVGKPSRRVSRAKRKRDYFFPTAIKCPSVRRNMRPPLMAGVLCVGSSSDD